MISVEEARARLLAPLRPLAAEQIGLNEALGRVLAEDLVSRRTQPPFAASAMDGYAARAADLLPLPARLKVIGEAPAGHVFAGTVSSGEAVRIFTGAPVPPGADCVVIQEDTERDGDWVTVRETAPAGRFIRVAGLDFRRGETLLSAGRILTSRDIALAAAMNRPWLSVRRRPRIAILVTGDEIALPGEDSGPGQIVSSNGFGLAALVTSCGGIPHQLGIARDDAAGLQRMAAGAAGADLLVTTGGVSVGDHDLVGKALVDAGLAIDFWKIAMRPGKPLMVGDFGGTRMLGLPGNPVSTFVCGLIFLKPAIETLLGLAPAAGTVSAVLSHDLPENDRRQDYLRGISAPGPDGALTVDPFPRQDSSMMALLAAANCLVLRPPFAPPAKVGTEVPIMPFPPGL